MENKEMWQICLGFSILVCGLVKAFLVARNPYLGGKGLSELNSFESSEYFIVRFLYDFVGSLTNWPYLFFIVLPMSLVMYGFAYLFN